MSYQDEKLRKVARDAVPSRVYSGNVLALRAVAALAWDEAVASMRYADGTPVEVVHVVNPYRQGSA